MFVVKSQFSALLNFFFFCEVGIALDMFLHPGRVELDFSLSPRSFLVCKVLLRFPTCYLIDVPTEGARSCFRW